MKSFFKVLVVFILTIEAKVLLKRKQPKIIAITGSVGKTSTKDAIYTILKNYKSTRKSEKSFNSELGVPLTVLGLPNAWNNPFKWFKNIIDGAITAFFTRQYPEILILEMGVDRPGDMNRLTSWLKLDVVVLTRLPVVPVHVEFFESPRAVIEEKMTLVRALKSDGIFIYNNDDEIVRREASTVIQQSLGFSRYSESHVSVKGDEIIYENSVPIGMKFFVHHFNDKGDVEVRGSVGIQHAYNYAAAIATASVFDITLNGSLKALDGHMPPPGRMKLIPGLKNTLIIDDTYNSSPVAAERALQTLKELEGARRKVAVLGDMFELGRHSSEEHEKLGKKVAQCADFLITIGVRSRKIAEGALEHGMSEKKILQYDDILRAANELQQLMKKGDYILVKASQSIRAEKLVEEIMAEPQKAEYLLVRQDEMWRNKPIG